MIQILDMNINKKGGNREVVAQYDHSCYTRKIRHWVPGCTGRIDSSSVLVPEKNTPVHIIQYNTIQYNTIQYNTMQYILIDHSS